ncbi:hypothetical protein [Thetidibacter halocola]|uniref:hypothetical protein n=1 Tax=Thetidibacter halocola TaxID=2827239 RepID=UPI001BA6BAC1|nr:hypothetical protein [Thetidibacter halocola]
MARLPRGFVYATTGEAYTITARRAARRMRQVCPDIPIDLFTDQEVEDPVFDHIHRLNRSTHRPKMEAMGRSRFGSTILLDSDTIVVTDISELFSMTRRFPLSAAFCVARASHLYGTQRDIPRWFPTFNAGLMVFRRGRRSRQLARSWQRMMDEGQLEFDQPSLRRLAWDLSLPVGIVPPEYNLIHIKMLQVWQPHMGAPRLLHMRKLHRQPPGDPEKPLDYHEELPPKLAEMIDELLAAEAQYELYGGPRNPPRNRLHRLLRVMRRRLFD